MEHLEEMGTLESKEHLDSQVLRAREETEDSQDLEEPLVPLDPLV